MTATDIRGVTRAPGLQVWGPLFALWLIWGSTYLAIAVVGHSMPPLVANGMRFAVAALVLATAITVTRGPRALTMTAAHLRATAAMGVGLLGIGIGTLSLAEAYVPSGVAALLVAVVPIWIIVFRVRAGEQPALLTTIGVVTGLVGLALMLLPGGTQPVSGTDGQVVLWSIAILGSSTCWAVFSWRSARYSLPANPLVTTTYELAFAALFLVVIGLVTGERVQVDQISAGSWWAFGWLVVASLAGFSAYTWLLGNAPMSLTATYAYVNPVVAVLLGAVILAEPITRDVLIGLTLVVGGVVLVVTGERRT